MKRESQGSPSLNRTGTRLKRSVPVVVEPSTVAATTTARSTAAGSPSGPLAKASIFKATRRGPITKTTAGRTITTKATAITAKAGTLTTAALGAKATAWAPEATTTAAAWTAKAAAIAAAKAAATTTAWAAKAAAISTKSTAAAAWTAITTWTAATWTTVFGLSHGESPASHLKAIHLADRVFTGLFGLHFNEAKPAAAACLTVGSNFHCHNRAVRGEKLF